MVSDTVGMQAFVHALLIMSTLMGSTWTIFATVSMYQLHSIVFASIRAIIYSTLLLPITLIVDRDYIHRKHVQDSKNPSWKSAISNKLPSLKGALQLAICGLFLSVNQLSFTAGLAMTSPNTTALFGPVNVVAISMGSIIVKHERATLLKIVGITISVLGAMGTALASIFSNGGGIGGSADLVTAVGYGLLTINVISNSAYINMQTTLMLRDGLPTLTVSFWCYFFSTIFTTTVATFFWVGSGLDNLTWQAWYGIIYSASFGAAIPWTVNAYGTRRLKPTARAAHQAMSPVYTALFSYVMLGDIIGWQLIVGALVITVGVICVAISKAKDTENASNSANTEKQGNKDIEQKEASLGANIVTSDDVELLETGEREESFDKLNNLKNIKLEQV